MSAALSVSMDRFLEHLELRRSGKVRESGPLPLREARVMVLLMECPLVLSEDIGCYPVLRKWLRVVEALSDGDSLFGAVTAMTEWLGDYAQRLLPSLCPLLSLLMADCVTVFSERLRSLVRALHQFMTLSVEEEEDAIEDLTDDWKVELCYDDMDDTDARDEVQQEVEKRQQRERDRYFKATIFPAIKALDIVFRANQAMAQRMDLAPHRTTDTDPDPEQEEEEKKSADPLPHGTEQPRRRRRVRLSVSVHDEASKELIGGLQRRGPLRRSEFHNDGLNAAICSNSQSRSVIHRRDLMNYREAEALRAEQGGARRRDRERSGSLLEYPYLLTAGSKARYLEFENLIRQHRARRRRMLDLMMGGAMGGMIGGLNRNRLMEELDLVLRISRKTIVRDTVAILALQQPGDLRKRLRFRATARSLTLSLCLSLSLSIRSLSIATNQNVH